MCQNYSSFAPFKSCVTCCFVNFYACAAQPENTQSTKTPDFQQPFSNQNCTDVDQQNWYRCSTQLFYSQHRLKGAFSTSFTQDQHHTAAVNEHTCFYLKMKNYLTFRVNLQCAHVCSICHRNRIEPEYPAILALT